MQSRYVRSLMWSAFWVLLFTTHSVVSAELNNSIIEIYEDIHSGSHSPAFTTQTTLILRHSSREPVSNLRWNVPADCSVDDAGANPAFMLCHNEGLHKINLSFLRQGQTSPDTMTKIIEIEPSHYCYSWRMDYQLLSKNNQEEPPSSIGERGLFSHEDNVDIDHTTVEIRMKFWIYHSQSAGSGERHGMAPNPSPSSASLTNQFLQLGLVPRVMAKFASLTYSTQTLTLVYNESGSFWEASLELDGNTKLHQVTLEVSSSPVAIYSCFVEDTTFFLPGVRYKNLTAPDHGRWFLESEERNTIRVFPDVCHTHVAAFALSDNILQITQDGFLSSFALSALPETSEPISTKAVALLFSYIVVLQTDGRLFYRSLLSDWKEYRLVSGERIVGLSSRDVCIQGLYSSPVQNNAVVLWTAEADIYVVNAFSKADKDITAVSLGHDDLTEIIGNHSALSIETVKFDNKPASIIIACTFRHNRADWKRGYLTYNMNVRKWSLLPVWMNLQRAEAAPSANFRVVGIPESLFLAHSGSSLFLSYSNGRDIVTKSSCECGKGDQPSSSNSAQPCDRQIKQLVVSDIGDIAALTQTGEVLYGKVGVKETVLFEVQTRQATDKSALWLDSYGRLYLLSSAGASQTESAQPDGGGSSSAGTSLEKKPIPVYSHLRAQTNFSLACPYHTFEHSLDDPLYRLDMGEVLQVRTHVVYHSHRREATWVQFHDAPTLKLTADTRKRYGAEFVSEQKFINVTHQYDFSDSVNGLSYYDALLQQSSQTALLEFGPAEPNLACDSPTRVHRKIFPECPPKRHIRIREGSLFRDCFGDLQSYVVPAGASYNTTTGKQIEAPREIAYPLEELGCPYLISGHGYFYPRVDVWDGDTFAKAGDGANFVLIEETGRADFHYSATMESAGCEQLAQTWAGQRAVAAEADIPLTQYRDVWGPHNYQSCYQATRGSNNGSAGSSEALSLHEKPYEVLNNSGFNQLILPLTSSSVYIFRLIVVDPNYSYCNLSVRFAARVYSTLPPDDLEAIAAANYSMALVVGGALTLTYLYHHMTSVNRINRKRGVGNSQTAGPKMLGESL